MNQITIYETDSALVERIAQLAEKNGIPPEEEARQLLRWAVKHVETNVDFQEEKPFSSPTAAQIEAARAFRKRYAHLQTTDSVELVREDRDR